MQGATSTAIRLYKFNPKKKGIESWELYAATVSPSFYDANEDSASGSSQWFLEAGELEVEVSDKFSFEESSKRATFAGDSGIWALRFPSQQAFNAFVTDYNSKLFENTYKLTNDESNREKVRCSQLATCIAISSINDCCCPSFVTFPQSEQQEVLKPCSMVQVFGKDTVLNMGGRETKESREQWLEDIEMKVCSSQSGEQFVGAHKAASYAMCFHLST